MSASPAPTGSIAMLNASGQITNMLVPVQNPDGTSGYQVFAPTGSVHSAEEVQAAMSTMSLAVAGPTSVTIRHRKRSVDAANYKEYNRQPDRAVAFRVNGPKGGGETHAEREERLRMNELSRKDFMHVKAGRTNGNN